jgi:allophanate hydrolase subunit 2
LRFNFPARVAIKGAKFKVYLNEHLIETNNSIGVAAGDQLKFGIATEGMYGYLAIQGGFIAPTVLGSVSFYEGITPVERIRKGDKLFFDPTSIVANDLSVNMEKIDYSTQYLEVMKGPEFDQLSDQTRISLKNDSFIISTEVNRMGYRLIGNEKIKGFDILTSPVQPGTIQLTSSGQLIVLMKDGQTTGGYSRVLQLSEIDLSILSQKRPGNYIKFNIL